MFRRITAANGLFTLLFLASGAFGQTATTTTPVTLGAGINLITVPHGSGIATAEELANRTGSPFLVRHVIRADGRAQFSAYISGLSPSFRVRPDVGYIISSPRMQTVTFLSEPTTHTMGVLVMQGGNTISTYHPTGELISRTTVTSAPWNLDAFGEVATDGKRLFVIENHQLDGESLVQYDPRTNARVVLAGPDRIFQVYCDVDGSVLYYRKAINTQYIHRINNGVNMMLFIVPWPWVLKAPYRVRGNDLFILMLSESASPTNIKFSKFQIWRVPLDQPNAPYIRLTAQPKGVVWFDVSRDGKRVVYTPVRPSTDIPIAVWTTETRGIGCEVKVSVDTNLDEEIPVFTANNTHVLFRRVKDLFDITLHLRNLDDILKVTPVLLDQSFPGHPQFLLPEELDAR